VIRPRRYPLSRPTARSMNHFDHLDHLRRKIAESQAVMKLKKS
jgi:hypothetical protein